MLRLVNGSQTIIWNKNESSASRLQYTGDFPSESMAANYMLQYLRSDDNIKYSIGQLQHRHSTVMHGKTFRTKPIHSVDGNFQPLKVLITSSFKVFQNTAITAGNIKNYLGW